MRGTTPRPDGLSAIFPAVPILSAISIVLCLLILPGFWKTRVFAVVYYLCSLIAGNGLLLVNTCIWRGNVRNIPIYCDIVALFWSVYPQALYMCILCVSKFIWTISKPAPSIRVYDGRRRTNIIDACLCIGFPVLTAPFMGYLFTARYTVIEDLGPWPAVMISTDRFFIDAVPIVLASFMIIRFNYLSCYNFWYSKHEKPSSDGNVALQSQRRALSTSQVSKYTLMSFVTVCGTAYGATSVLFPYIYRTLEPGEGYQWYNVVSLTNDQWSDRKIHIHTREWIEANDLVEKQSLIGFAYTLPFIGIQVFLCFGLGSEARKTYVGWIRAFINLIFNKRLSGWSKGLVRVAIRVATQLKVLAGKPKWRKGRYQKDTNTLTPSQTNNIVSDELSVPWHSTSTPLLPAVTPPASSSSKRQQSVVAPMPLWKEYRKVPLPTGSQQRGIDRDPQEEQQPDRPSKAGLLQARPVYIIHRKSAIAKNGVA
ncbi:a-factor receptor [Serendipita sp. 398]|nr:a-factor receptor [Serendipita sp. 398]